MRGSHKIQLTPKAYSVFYSSPAVVIVDAGIARDSLALFPNYVRPLALNDNGLICEFSEINQEIDQSLLLNPRGIPGTLKAVFYSEATQIAADQIYDLVKLTKLHIKHAKYFIDNLNASEDHKALIDSFVCAMIADGTTRLSFKEEQIAHLRIRNEWLSNQLEQARQLLKASGYDECIPVLQLGCGDSAIGPKADEKQFSTLINLNVDVTGICDVAFYFDLPEQPFAQGYIQFRLINFANQHVLASETVEFDHVPSGWFNMHFRKPIQEPLGDGAIEVVWNKGDDGEAPALRLSETIDESGALIPAMKVYARLFDPSQEERIVNVYEPDTIITKSFAELAESAQFIDGQEQKSNIEKDVGFPILSVEDNALQTHVLSDQVNAFRFKNAIPIGVNELLFKLGNPIEVGPDTAYLACLVPVDSKINGSAIEGLFAHCTESNETSGGYAFSSADNPTSVPIHYGLITLKSGAYAEMPLTVTQDIDETLDLIIAVKSLDGKIEYGQSRWLDVTMTFPYRQPAATYNIPPSNAEALTSTIKFSEIARFLSFAQGYARAQQISIERGFNPMLISGLGGCLQIHPLENELSAVIGRSLIPNETIEISTIIKTAHAAAADITYILAAAPQAKLSWPALQEDIKSQIDSGEIGGSIAGEQGGVWTSVVLPAQEKQRLVLDTSNLRNTGNFDVVFAVYSPENMTSYGWCRFYDLSTHQKAT